MTPFNYTWHRLALLPLRLVVGFGFIAHGMAKWTRGPQKFGNLLHVSVL
jgi:putative oxidoreductase